jgi:uncharacterized protein YvpB
VRRLVLAMAVWMALMPLALAPRTAEPALAASGKVWVQVGSETPGSGCWVNTSVEVHQGGPASDVEIGLAFHIDSDVFSVNRGVTGGDGIAYLGFDTSGAPAGRAAMLDVNVAGVYVGSVPVIVSDGAGCNDNPKVFEFGGSFDAGQAWESSHSVASSATDTGIWVPTRYQQRGLSCEFASLSIAMAAYGTEITEWAFDPYISQSRNPHWGFRGNISGTWGGSDDYGIYAEPLAAILPSFGYWGDVFYARGDAGALTRRIDQGTPVLVWLGLLGDTSFWETGSDGTSYKVAAGQHTLVIYGYDSSGVYASDPALGAKRFYDWGWFMTMWNVFDGMSLAIGPA